MYSNFQSVYKYLKYYISASNGKGHGIHSPFIFEFITTVLNDQYAYPEYEKVEGLRNQLLKNDTMINVLDLGAGSLKNNNKTRSISSIAKSAAKNKKLGQLLFRMAKYYKPSTIVELGTSLGITTSYLSLSNPDTRIHTIEGSPEIANQAEANFNELGLSNIELLEGNFDLVLNPLLSSLNAVGFAFIDGNHRKEPTTRYFNDLLTKIQNDSIMVFDDIHWSVEMEGAWEIIKKHPSVRCSIDLFFIGIIFFRAEFKEKQEFVIRF